MNIQASNTSLFDGDIMEPDTGWDLRDWIIFILGASFFLWVGGVM